MAFTRFSYDVDRTKKQLQQSTDPGRFIINVPGPGESVTFMDDPHYRLTKWGGNIRTNTVNLESDLRGLTRNLNRDHLDQNNYEKRSVITSATHHKICDKSYTDQSRASHPAGTGSCVAACCAAGDQSTAKTATTADEQAKSSGKDEIP